MASTTKFVVPVVGLPGVKPLKCNSCFPGERGCRKTQKPSAIPCVGPAGEPKTLCGGMVTRAFWVIARSLKRGSIVRDYMIISAYGLVLIFISNQAVLLVNLIYPPFGLVTVSFMGVSSYLLLLGVYSSAISVSEDSKLRQSIRQIALKEPKLLDSIGTAQMEQEIQRRVLAVTKKTQAVLTEETGIQSSLNEDDMKLYLQQVIEEVKKSKSRTNDPAI